MLNSGPAPGDRVLFVCVLLFFSLKNCKIFMFFVCEH